MRVWTTKIWIVFSALLAVEVAMCAIFLYSYMFGAHKLIRRFFRLNDEANITSWFSSSQLLIVGMILLLHGYWLKPKQISRPGYLKLVGLGFVFMSIDETAKIHEQWLGHLYDFGLEHTVWAVYYGLFGLVMLVIGLRPLREFYRSFPTQFWIMLLGIILFITGGVVLEYLGHSFRDNESGLAYTIQVMFEEFLEMFGINRRSL